MRVERSLNELGLTKTTGSVYLALLQLDQGSAQEIANQANLPRTTVLGILKQLAALGLVKTTPSKNRVFYKANHPEKLQSIINTRRKALTEIMLDLAEIYHQGSDKPIVKFYEGFDGAKEVYEDTLKIGSKTYYQIDSTFDIYNNLEKDSMADYVTKRIQNKINLKVIRSYKKKELDNWPSNPAELREVRYTHLDFTFLSTVLIYDNKVAIIDDKQESFGLIIESADLYYCLKKIFEEVWKFCSPKIPS
ncbi:MAG: helix-turn-helix domain-containing protein [Candidatus Komeilibacteria bacterium]|nr:helix-turn-helix domain-containing protein [Candidatus Komeilibacteria bacterium]